jgi:hypothetical protein
VDVVVLHPRVGPALWVAMGTLIAEKGADLRPVDGLEPPRVRPGGWPGDDLSRRLRRGTPRES